MVERSESRVASKRPKTEELNPQCADVLESGHIIAALRNLEGVSNVMAAPTETVYLLFGSPLSIVGLIKSLRDKGKLPLVNLDLLSGFSRDSVNAEYLARCGAAGIISTHYDILRASRNQGLITVQRTFGIDSAAVEAGLRTLTQFQPDAVEVLPAVAAPRVAARFRQVHPNLRVVAGGLLNDLKEAEYLLASGIDAVSVSDPRMWIR